MKLLTDYSVDASPQLYARAGGALYLILIVLGAVAQALVRDKLIVPGDASATASNIVATEPLWRLGVVFEFISLICVTALAMIYFVLLRPVSRELNLFATFLRLVGIAVQAVAVLNLVGALLPLGDAPYLKAFTPGQLQAMMSLAIRAHAYGFGLALLIFGSCFLVHGLLIMRSGFLPRILGILIEIAGLCYMANSLVLFLAPALEDRIFPAILLPSFIGEASLCLWLLIKGVDVDRWREVNALASRRATR